jgi:hypothetical protein
MLIDYIPQAIDPCLRRTCANADYEMADATQLELYDCLLDLFFLNYEIADTTQLELYDLLLDLFFLPQ